MNPGQGNRNFWYVGWLVQRRISHLATPGIEIFYTTPDQVGGGANLRFNLGLVLDLTEHHHLLLSAGRGIVGDNLFQGYLAYQLTIGRCAASHKLPASSNQTSARRNLPCAQPLSPNTTSRGS